MGDGFSGSGRSYDTVPQRDEVPVLYSEGDEPGKVLEFIDSLSDESTVYVEDYDRGMLSMPAESPEKGSEVARELEAEDQEGYVFALYDTDQGSSSPETSELYAAFSGALPRNFTQMVGKENPRMVNGTRVTGRDENLNTEELWRKARKAGIKESRPKKRVDNIWRTFFGHEFR